MARDHLAKTHLVCSAFRLADNESGCKFLFFWSVLCRDGRIKRASHDKSVCNGCWMRQRPSKAASTGRTLAVRGNGVIVLISTLCRSGLAHRIF